MKGPDLDRLRSEKVLSLKEFIVCYNEGLPEEYAIANAGVLKAFAAAHPHLFKKGPDEWSLDQHRKRVMDWLPAHVRKDAPAA